MGSTEPRAGFDIKGQVVYLDGFNASLTSINKESWEVKEKRGGRGASREMEGCLKDEPLHVEKWG